MKKLNTTHTVYDTEDDLSLKIPARRGTGLKGRPPGLSGRKIF